MLVNENLKVYDFINVKYKDLLWGLRFVRLEETWQDISNEELSKVRIALIDSGVDAKHEDLIGSISKGYNFIDNNTDTKDEFGHGTRIAGVIVANKNNNTGIAGVASGAQIVPLKVMNSSGRASIKNVIRAIEWCIKEDIDIINLSIGYKKDVESLINYNSQYHDKERQVIEEALEKGITIVSSVGNNRNAPMNYPACFKGVISVASYGIYSNNLEIYPAPKNSKCSNKTIYAPGEYIYTTEIGNKYMYEFGSSIACGFVTGAIALMKSRNKNLKPSEIQEILIKSSTKIENKKMNILNIDYAFKLANL